MKLIYIHNIIYTVLKLALFVILNLCNWPHYHFNIKLINYSKTKENFKLFFKVFTGVFIIITGLNGTFKAPR